MLAVLFCQSPQLSLPDRPQLRQSSDRLVIFLDYPQSPFEDNSAERQIWPAVILRKNSQSNRFDRARRHRPC
ncbi:MAG: IS66 family transposase [Planctomycetes bacterium]|nr:IS66 family transposase [Planctomycetota bacterium]